MIKRTLFYILISLPYSLFAGAELPSATGRPDLLPENYFPELAQALQSLDTQAPELAVRRAYIQAAEEGESIAFAKKFPQATIELNLLHRQEFRDEDPEHQSTTQPFSRAYFSQAIYHWGAIDANHEISRIRKLLETGHYQESYRRLLIDVRRIYLDLVYKREQIQVQDEHLNILRKHYETNKRNAEENRVSSNVLEESSILLDTGLLTQEQLKSELQYLHEEFARITGSKQTIQGGLLNAIAPLADVSSNIATIEDNPYADMTPAPSMSLLNSERLLAIEQENYTIITAKVRPKFNLVGETYRDQVSSAGRDNVDRIVAQIVFNVSWNIFDGWETKHRRLQSKAQQRRLQAEADQLRDQQWIESKRLLRHRKLILKELGIGKRKIALSEANVKAAELNFNSGSITLSQMMESINTNNLNKLHHTRLKINYLMNTIQLLSLYGQDPLVKP